jgi:tryptophan-rich sensory protein
MMAVAAWLVWRARDAGDVAIALGLFGVQLAFNLSWSVIFFGLRRPAWARSEILLLWAFIAATIAAFWIHDPIAGVLQVALVTLPSGRLVLIAGATGYVGGRLLRVLA